MICPTSAMSRRPAPSHANHYYTRMAPAQSSKFISGRALLPGTITRQPDILLAETETHSRHEDVVPHFTWYGSPSLVRLFSTLDSAMSALNRQLGESAANVAFYDQLPAGSHARALLGRRVFDQLMEEHRYTEAVVAQPFNEFTSLFDVTIKQFETHPERKGKIRYIRQSGGKELEALAGAGDLDHARELLQILLQADSSQATIGILRDHLERAGHGELLPERARDSSR